MKHPPCGTQEIIKMQNLGKSGVAVNCGLLDEERTDKWIMPSTARFWSLNSTDRDNIVA